MSFTYEQVNIFIILAILGSIIYMLIYSKKGLNKSIGGYAQALSNCIVLTVISVFIIVGIFIIKVCLTQPLYPGLIVPIGWLFIAYICLKRILNNDFGINLHIFNPNLKIFNIIKDNKIVILLGIITVGFGFFTYMILFKVLPDRENQPYGPVPIFIVGIIFLITTIILARVVYLKITGKIKFDRIEENKFDNTTKFSIERKNKKKAKNRWESPNIFLIFFMIIGILLILFGLKINGSIKEKTVNYLETVGYFIDAELYSRDIEEGNTYSLIYYYEVNRIGYTVSTDYGTAFIPEYGAKQIVKYNPDNPGEAIIEGNNSSIMLYFIGGFFIFVPAIMMAHDMIFNIKNAKKRKVLELILNIVIGMFFIAISGAIYYFMCIGSGDFSIGTAIKSAGFIIIFPLVFFIAGMFIICSNIYIELKKVYIKRNRIQ